MSRWKTLKKKKRKLIIYFKFNKMFVRKTVEEVLALDKDQYKEYQIAKEANDIQKAKEQVESMLAVKTAQSELEDKLKAQGL